MPTPTLSIERLRRPLRRLRAAALIACCAVAPAACALEAADRIEGSGTLEIVEAEVAPTSGARMDRVLVREGDRVKVGDTIAVLSIPTLAADLARARADEARALAAYDELQAGARAREIEGAEAEVAAREADLARLVADSTRLAPIVAQLLATDAEMSSLRASVRAAAAQRDAATAALRLLREGARHERVAAAAADVARARAIVSAVESTAQDLVLRAAVDGIVVSRNAEPGEVVAAGRSVATIGDTKRLWVRVYLGPRHTPLVRVGDTVTAVLDAFPDREFTGHVASIATTAEYTPRVALTETERADLLFAVRVELEDDSETLKAGLPVTVRFGGMSRP